MAETIGRAYVKILADGTGLGPEIERELREHEDAFRAQGRRDSKAYTEEFGKGIDESPTWAKLNQALQKGIARGDLSRDFFNSPTWQNFEKDLERNYGDVGRRAGINMRNEFIQQGRLPQEILKDLENITPQITRATREIADEMGKPFEEVKKQTEEMVRDVDVKTKRAGASFHRLGNQIDSMADIFGKAFGKGARNNFVNLIGVMISGTIKFAGAVAKGFGTAIDWIAKGAQAVFKFGGNVEKMGMQAEEAGAAVSTAVGEGAMTTVATGGISAAAGILVFVGALEIAAFSAGILAGAISALAGIVVAMAATIATALGGALLIVAPLVVTLAAAIGGTVLVVKELSDASGPLKTGLNSIKDAAKGIGSAFTDRALKNAPRLMGDIADMVKELKPLARAAGDGFRRMATNLVEALDSPAVQRFRDTMEQFLPKAMGTLGDIAGNLAQAFAGIFTAAAPFAQRFLDWLEDLTGRFSDWVNSGKGQNSIADFLERAADSAESLGNFIGGAWDLLTNLITAGQPTGDTLWDTIGDKLTEWGDWIRTHGDEMQQWFSDAADFAERLGTAIESIATAFDELDTPENRQLAGDLVAGFGKAIEWTAKLLSVIQQIAPYFKFAAGGPVIFIEAAKKVKDVAGNIKDAFAGLVGPVVGFFTGLALNVLSALRSIMNGAFSVVRGILGAWAKLPGPLGAPARAAQTEFETFARNANSDLDSVEGSIREVQNMANNPMELQLSTAEAQSKIAGLMTAINNLFRVWGNPPVVHVPSAPRTSPTAVEQGVTSGSAPSTITGGPKPHPTAPGTLRTGVTINVTTPTKDPVGVANETVNRLVGVGYAN